MIIRKLMELLYEEPNVVKLNAPITVCGDIHGQLFDLFELLKISGDPVDTKYLFLGDYVDRGYFSLETFLYVAALKLKYPTQICLLRGNHECRQVSKQYGFYDECVQNYGHGGIWNLCQDCFDILPLAAVIDNRIFCVHGGLSPELLLIEQISLINRQQEIPISGAMTDLLWSDPEDVGSWSVSTRGAGWLFGATQTNIFCQQNRIDLIARAHQLVMEGYQYKFDEKVITVWSAPNYGYRTGNVASVMKLDSDLNRELRIFKDVPEVSSQKPVDMVPHYFT
jgi:diadenosine tetraphosphatase ApaH/serine/threonine PP2A family protein phosphatase